MAPVKEEKRISGEKCQECWGKHPTHRSYCSWSVGSKLANANIVSPEYKNTKDQKVEVNGGYAGVARHVEDPWGASKATAKAEDTPKEEAVSKQTGSKTEVEGDWVKVEGNWVEL